MLFAEVAQVVISSSAIFADVECIRDKLVLEGFLKLGFTPCKTEQPQSGMELQEKKYKRIKA